MTTREFIEKQKRKIAKLEKGVPLAIAAFEIHRQMGNRIFNEGESANESTIGSYATSPPIYVNPQNSPKKFQPQGITGKVFKSGKNKGQPHKTRLFSSYRSFRQYIGRQTGFVNLDLSGRLRSDFITGLRKKSPTMYESVLKYGFNAKKARGQEKHWGKKIFSLTPTERKLFVKIVQDETNRIMNA